MVMAKKRSSEARNSLSNLPPLSEVTEAAVVQGLAHRCCRGVLECLG